MKFNGEKVLITGANGFLGYHLINRLLRENVEIYGLIKKNDYRIKDIKGIEIHKVDLVDSKKVAKIIKNIKPKKVYHLAAHPDEPLSLNSILKMNEDNVYSTINLLQALRDLNFDSFVYISSYKVYGNIEVPYKEGAPEKPTSVYGITKLISELYINCYYYNFKLPIVRLKLSTLYGPYQNIDSIIPITIISCLKKKDVEMTKGEQKREFTYVSDVVEAIVLASLEKKAIGEVINIGCRIEYSIKEIVTKIIKLMGNPIKPLLGALPYRQNEIWHMYGDNSKAIEMLNWKPQIDLEQGLKNTIKWFRDNFKE